MKLEKGVRNMSLLTWMVFGLIAGSIANMIDPSPSRGGWLGSIVLGIVGAVIGGFLANALFGVGISGFNVSSFIVAIVGSLIVLYGAKSLRSSSI
jgi:uncharacterized membrane protein YeaQ/YmgE (transglycosylase-associated protein family)